MMTRTFRTPARTSRAFQVLAPALALLLLSAPPALAGGFRVGYAKRDVTPRKSVPMWGYGGLGPRMSRGILDPLYAKCVVIDAGDSKVAIMGLDIGRGPRESSLAKIQAAVKETSGVDAVLISGSHTHHGPVTELKNEDGLGRGKYDDTVAWIEEFENHMIDAINEAAAGAVEAKMARGSVHVPLSRNRHTKVQPKPVEDELTVLRFDDMDGKTIALVVNFSAHPTILPAFFRKFSAEWVGAMNDAVEAELGTNCLFMQGSAGDMSPNTSDITRRLAEEFKARDEEAAKARGEELDRDHRSHFDIYIKDAFGRQMADEVVKLARTLEPAAPAEPSIMAREDVFHYEDTRVDFGDKELIRRFGVAFFPELVACLGEDWATSIDPRLITVIINRSLAIVGGSGEFFSNHSIRLKERGEWHKERLGVEVIFFGYCNGHHMYFPTIEAVAEGGYGADPLVSYVPPGAGEEMMNRALINIYDMLGDIDHEVTIQ